MVIAPLEPQRQTEPNRRRSVPRHSLTYLCRRLCGASSLGLWAWTVALLMLIAAPCVAQAPSRSTAIGKASVALPDGWHLGYQEDIELSGMGARMVVASAPDDRISVYILVIDPFGVDIVTWKFEDLLAPTLLDLLAYSGASAKHMRVRNSPCHMGGDVRDGRLIIRPVDTSDDDLLLAGLACGIVEPSRWAAAFVVVEAGYDRPLLLRRDLKDANALIDSFRFE